MDWRLAKTILIGTFILLNGFLGFQLHSAMEQRSHSIIVDKITDQQIQKLLADNQVQFSAQKPESSLEEMPVWQASVTPIPEWQKTSSGEYMKTLNKPIPVPKEPKSLEQFLKQHVKQFDDYSLFQKTATKILYLQKYKSYTLFDGKLEVVINEGKITALKMTHFHIQEQLNPVKLTPFNNALYNLINQQESEQRVVSEVSIGFYKRGYSDDSIFLIPIWLFQMNGQYYYVNATNLGSLEKVEPAQPLN